MVSVLGGDTETVCHALVQANLASRHAYLERHGGDRAQGLVRSRSGVRNCLAGRQTILRCPQPSHNLMDVSKAGLELPQLRAQLIHRGNGQQHVLLPRLNTPGVGTLTTTC